MPKLYDSYCYNDVVQACQSFSTGYTILTTSDYLFFPNGFTDTGDGEGCMINFIKRNAVTNQQTSLSQYVSFPDCNSVGFHHNLSGLSLTDVNEVAWLVVLVWASVWSIKLMRR